MHLPSPIRSVAVLIAALILAGCGAPDRTREVGNARSGERMVTATVLVEDVGVPTDPVAPQYLQTYLTTALWTRGFLAGPGLRLYVAFTRYADRGAAKRPWFDRLIGVETGDVTVRTRFVNRAGQVLAETRTDAEVGANLLGDDLEQALADMSEQIAAYAQQTFLAY